MSVYLLKKLNKFFKLPQHPFNMQNDGTKSYAMWQFEKGEQTIKNYTAFVSADEMFKNKDVLDVGCGAGGKSLYYLTLGASKVVGIDVVEKYGEESLALSQQLKLDGFEFVCADASSMPFDDNTFDTVIMNDAMEHVGNPEKTLCEVYRVLKPGGRLYVNFPPYNHPFGAHLSDAVGIPWVHVLFSDKTLISAYKELVKDLPDGKERIEFRISKNEKNEEYFSYINKMSIKRFNKILSGTNFNKVFYAEMPLRNIFKVFAKMPLLKEFFVKMVVCVLEK